MINKVVMVVDDESDMLTLLELMLKGRGLVVMKAPDADRALHLVKSLTPNLFILDILMPGMNGYELCQQLRANSNTADTPVIMFSVLDNPRAKKKALESGANVFVTKTNLTGQLIDEVCGLLNQKATSPL